MVPPPDTNNMNNDNSNTAQGDQIAAAFINAIAQVVLASPDLNKSLISFSNAIEVLKGRMEVLERYGQSADRERVEGVALRIDQLEGEVSELRDQLSKIRGRLEDVEDTVSECDGLRHRVDDLESQVEDLDAVTTDQVEDIVSDRMNDMGPLTCRNIVTLGLRGLVDKAVTEGVKI
jgi:predicted nuclease with TOPRIM domain